MLKIFGNLLDFNEKELKKLRPLVEKINSLEPGIKKLKDKDFPKKTESFKERINKGESLDDLLPEAFALAREAIFRVVGERAFDVQLIAAITLHQGRIAEQKTGEGKTLSAAMTAYLNALSGHGVHIVTVNDYLARRDTGWYGQALTFAGLKLGCLIHEQAFLLDLDYQEKGEDDERLRHLRPVERKEAYLADITYGTNNEFGFDYLRDNMARRFEDQVQRKPHFAIVDEVDSILIDEARTPLIISAPDTEPTQKYYEFANLIRGLSSDTDYVIDEKLKTANLTDHGLRKVEKILNIDNLYEKDFDTIHHIENALKARTLYLQDRDYVVKENQVIIVDEFTGRLMFGRRWSDGLHQAVEAKEGVPIQQESITMATISFQNYFRMYQKLAGMTGTAATEEEEFRRIYGLETIIIPTNLPMIRLDYADIVYKTPRAKYAAVVREIEECYQKGQPVLIGTTSIEKNEIVDKFLKKKGIPHNVLNAKAHEKEAKILAEAGHKKAVTVATNMAGRGVDIVLGGSKEGREKKSWEKEHEEVVRLGGLHVVGTERHESRRIDNQLRGRSGRQGDPGSSRFFISLDDDVMRLFGGEQIANLMGMLRIPEDQPIEHGLVSKAIQQAQVKVEGFNFDMRKRVVEYDDVMNKQREIIYGKREKILRADGEKNLELKEQIQEKMNQYLANLVNTYSPEGLEKVEVEQIINNFCEVLPLDSGSQSRLKEQMEKVKTPQEINDFLRKILMEAYESREKQVGLELMREIEKFVWLQSIDRLWIDHLDAMDNLREGVGLRGYGQQDPLVEYKKEAYTSFEKLMGMIEEEVIKRLFRIQVAQPPPQYRNIQTNVDTKDKMGLKPSTKNKPGRNDPCPCGKIDPKTGKPIKYKKCCYPKYG
ncbi:preprotein translocase subunit SecA [Candidatus Woesebacteria bacterium CG_4_10_14_0_2_um_filter_39_14]|uniref:Protein translocase subunit SecA n=1 Tax=Candidatus Woesebacteria bacterium CG_4_10_14_0_2_um_filter_39_14 TaxID=1975054 RepID=A0A2M7TP85_9BACT|nr:MAG: preprotein translocase subunit SecA [Candidatus Woesebacteria bacterium CG_4_10_14_0_2_um_filter_39_14]